MNAFTAAVMESKVLRNENYKESGTIDYEEEVRGAGESIKDLAARVQGREGVKKIGKLGV